MTTLSKKKLAPRKRSKKQISDDKFADKMLRQIKTSPAILSCDEVDRIEQTWATLKRGRRCQLALFTKPGKFIVDKIAEDREFAVLIAEILAHTEDTMKFYEGLLKLMKTTSVRTSIALCYRDDMPAVLKEGGDRYRSGQSSDLESAQE